MKLSKKIITLLVVVLAVALIAPCALAAGDTSVEAGKTVPLTFTFTDVYNVDGVFTISDPQKILSTYSIDVADGGATVAVISGDRLWASPTAAPVKTTVSINVVLSMKPSAAVGSKCTVNFNGIYGDANEAPGNEHDINQSVTVTVKATAVPVPTPSVTPSQPVNPSPSVEPTPSTPPTVEPTPTPTGPVNPSPSVEPTPSTPPTVEPTPTPTDPVTPNPSTEPTPSVPPTQPVEPTPSGSQTPTGTSVDYSKLQKQINIASGLVVTDYTNESRALLAEALTAAQNALTSQEQSAVDAALENLGNTISGLVRMDYSGLKAALARANALLGSENAAVLWQQLSDAAELGNQLLQSGDQEAVDQATAQLTDILDSIVALVEADVEPKVVIQEVPVEVLPDGDYCNISSHHVWMILLWVSAGVNLLLIAVIVAYVIRRTKNRRDDTPLVDYDIDDDY